MPSLTPPVETIRITDVAELSATLQAVIALAARRPATLLLDHPVTQRLEETTRSDNRTVFNLRIELD